MKRKRRKRGDGERESAMNGRAIMREILKLNDVQLASWPLATHFFVLSVAPSRSVSISRSIVRSFGRSVALSRALLRSRALSCTRSHSFALAHSLTFFCALVRSFCAVLLSISLSLAVSCSLSRSLLFCDTLSSLCLLFFSARCLPHNSCIPLGARPLSLSFFLYHLHNLCRPWEATVVQIVV